MYSCQKDVLEEWGCLVEVKRADGVSEFYRYVLDGNLTRQEDVTGKVTEYRYNALDLLEKVTDNGTMRGPTITMPSTRWGASPMW